jgi:hypothetical protein
VFVTVFLPLLYIIYHQVYSAMQDLWTWTALTCLSWKVLISPSTLKELLWCMMSVRE